MDLTDKQWALIEPLFETKRRADGRGRPWRDGERHVAPHMRRVRPPAVRQAVRVVCVSRM
jgi:hypothetical protein